MEDEAFKPEEGAFILDTMERVEAELESKVFEIIKNTEKDADDKFSSFGVEFKNFSPANRDYLTASLLDTLFLKLHKNDKKTAEWIIYNLKGQSGILTKEDKNPLRRDT